MEGGGFQVFKSIEIIEELSRKVGDEVMWWEEAKAEHIILLDEINWKKKSMALWLREGDRNTKFFYILANFHKRHN